MSIQAAGYVGAARIAASAAFVGLVLGKEQKTTEFRQAWINAQREDLATLMSAARAAREGGEERAKVLRDFDLAHSRVLLRENPDAAEWLFVLDELKRLRGGALRLRRGAHRRPGLSFPDGRWKPSART